MTGFYTESSPVARSRLFTSILSVLRKVASLKRTTTSIWRNLKPLHREMSITRWLKNLYLYTVTQLHYLNKAIERKIPDGRGNVVFLHDNARPETTKVVYRFFRPTVVSTHR